jgi:hypothetical protein
MFDLRRCEFIPLLGGAAVYPPPAARAQQLGRTVLLHALVENDLEAQAPVVAFRQGLEGLASSCGVTEDRLSRH